MQLVACRACMIFMKDTVCAYLVQCRFELGEQIILQCANLQVLHTRSCSGTGMSFVRFLAACYLTFNMDAQTVDKGLEALPVLPVLDQASGALGKHA